MKKTFSFCNQKGGVGKTTSVINLATVLGQSGHKVLVIDLDAQANATSGLGEEKASLELSTYQLLLDSADPSHLIRRTKFENLDLIPSGADLSGVELELINKESREFMLKAQIKKICGSYDFVLIDCPPSLGLVTINALVGSDFLIIPLQCEYYSLEGLGLLLTTFQLIQKNLNSDLEIGGVILTMADFRTNLTQQVVEEVRSYFKEKVFATVIPRSVKLSEAPSFGKPAVVYDPLNRGSKSYQDIGKEFVHRFAQKQTEKNFEKLSEINQSKETNLPQNEEVSS